MSLRARSTRCYPRTYLLQLQIRTVYRQSRALQTPRTSSYLDITKIYLYQRPCISITLSPQADTARYTLTRLVSCRSFRCCCAFFCDRGFISQQTSVQITFLKNHSGVCLPSMNLPKASRLAISCGSSGLPASLGGCFHVSDGSSS